MVYTVVLGPRWMVVHSGPMTKTSSLVFDHCDPRTTMDGVHSGPRTTMVNVCTVVLGLRCHSFVATLVLRLPLWS